MAAIDFKENWYQKNDWLACLKLKPDLSQNRTKNYLKQLKVSIVFRFLTIGSSFLLVPIMIKYLGKEQYGIWSTLLSVISWVVLFDMGIGNGLRNKIAESLAKGNIEDAQGYVSTSYVLIGSISGFLILLFCILSGHLSWQNIFNSKALSEAYLSKVVNVTAGFVLLNFWLSLINQVVNGLQKSSIVIFNQFLSNFGILILVYILSITSERSLMSIACLCGASSAAANITVSLWFYSANKNLIPKIALYKKAFVKSILSLGFQFFIVQIAFVIIFTTDRILITQLFGPEHVASYDVVFKLFSVISLLHSLLMTPIWSSYTDAYHRGDTKWIKNTLQGQLKIWGCLVAAVLLLSSFAKPIIRIWIGNELGISNAIITSLTLFIIISCWNNIFSTFLNGVGKVFVQSLTAVIASIVNIPLSIYFAKHIFVGVQGVVIGSIFSLSIFALCGPIQTFFLLKERK